MEEKKKKQNKWNRERDIYKECMIERQDDREREIYDILELQPERCEST